MDRAWCTGFARAYGLFDDPPSPWRPAPRGGRRSWTLLWTAAERLVRRIALLGWGA